MTKNGRKYASFLGLLLSACGGGSGGGALVTPPPVITQAVVTGIAPLRATVGVLSTFTVSGRDLPAGMSLSISGCDGSAEVAGGTSTSRQFSCIPKTEYGNHAATVLLPGSLANAFSAQIDFQAAVTSADSSNWRFAVVAPDGSLFVWGIGILQGDSVGKVVATPTKIGDDYVSVATGLNYTLAIKRDGSLWGWGSNSDDTLGTGSPSWPTTPVQVGTGFKKIALKGAGTVGGESVVALKTDGSVWVWGTRSSPQAQSVDSAPFPWQMATGFSDIATGAAGEMLGLKPDGTLWSWNRNISDTPFIPVKVGEGYVAVATGANMSFGLKSDGTLWNWGRNAPNSPPSGIADVAHPVLVGSGFRWIASGTAYAMAIKDDGSLWAGGSNSEGQFGDNSSNGGAFRQVGSGYIAVWPGYTCTIAQKPDASFWAWGLCDFGDGNYTQRSPVARKLAIP